METVLVTGAAGFIGYHLSQRLLALGHRVIGFDNLNHYYDVSLKKDRLSHLQCDQFAFQGGDISDRMTVESLFTTYKPDAVVHLAAQAGVRYSLTHPYTYIESNLVGFFTVLDQCYHHKCQHLVFASSSSVYGANRKIPFATTDPVNSPISLYAATKRSNELMAYSYSHLYKLPTTGLRFFTVYGPWGRPDMAYFLFARAIFNGDPIKVYNHGKMYRDFTYIDDIVEGIVRVLKRIPQTGRELALDQALIETPPFKIYNIGNNQPVSLLTLIETLESLIGKPAQKQWLPLQPGEVIETYADIDELIQDTGFKPSTSLDVGLSAFVEWYRSYYGAS